MNKSQQDINLDQARTLLKNIADPWGPVRIYAEYLDGVYEGQITDIKSEVKLDELTSVYRVRIYVTTTYLEDLIGRA